MILHIENLAEKRCEEYVADLVDLEDGNKGFILEPPYYFRGGRLYKLFIDGKFAVNIVPAQTGAVQGFALPPDIEEDWKKGKKHD
jgi:sensor domain CHASE-containing protein